MIDLHCHLLPGVDDGPRDLATAIALSRASVANGIKQAVLTPHVFAGRWENAVSSLSPTFDHFVRALREHDVPLEVFLGGEIHLQPEAFNLLDINDLPVVGGWRGYKVVLLEFPDSHIPVGAMKAVEMFMRRGVLPMIAHPERNKDVMRNVKRIEPFVKAGCLLQLTGASVCGLFGAPAHKTSLKLLDAGWATVIATDAHNLAHRPPIMNQARAALDALYGSEAGEVLTEANPRVILQGRPEFARVAHAA